jgi:hypothetical protein
MAKSERSHEDERGIAGARSAITPSAVGKRPRGVDGRLALESAPKPPSFERGGDRHTHDRESSIDEDRRHDRGECTTARAEHVGDGELGGPGEDDAGEDDRGDEAPAERAGEHAEGNGEHEGRERENGTRPESGAEARAVHAPESRVRRSAGMH